ncbi:hypothetical protein UFOVP126_16 [uncultured Caudovirales phage]|uniref:Uncharacterized protein n=1 Tax=uncultured Caudovirales phage TaxID=2100421 RepID=A0A6J5L9X5_9CAUD|nr:hypothetical protein UFOVP126_16 [uncultured Caudovirales phage]
MSSTSAPFGFRASFHNSGQMRPKAYTVASGYAANIFSGDPVKLTTAGTIQLGSSDGTRSGTTDGIKLLGVFAGCQYNDVTGKPTISPFWPSGVTATNIVAWVYDDPETLFDVQYTNPGTPGTTSMQSAVGQECDWVVASPGGSTQTGLSNTQLTATQTTSGQFQITGFAYEIKDSITDAYAVVTVRLNEAHYKASVNAVA